MLCTEMDDFEQEGINEELIEFAIRESIQEAHKLPCSSQTNRYERVQIVYMSLSTHQMHFFDGVVNFLQKMSRF